jgi:hypothetical protein
VHKLPRLEVLAVVLGMTMAFTVGMTAICTGHDGVIVTAVCSAISVFLGYLLRGGGRTGTASGQPSSTLPGDSANDKSPSEDERQKHTRRFWHFGRKTWEKG